MATIVTELEVKVQVSRYVDAKKVPNYDLQRVAIDRLADTMNKFIDGGGSINDLSDLVSGKKK